MKALICGVGGQDGAYLARLLLEKGYRVVGTSRDATTASFLNLRRLGILDKVETVSLASTDFKNTFTVLSHHRPDEVYNLSGQSSVGLSFEQPVETMESIVTATLNFLEAIRLLNHPIRFYNAGSSECFGDTGLNPATEDTPFHPKSPYAVAKTSAQQLVALYREAYALHACTGILFNHESPLRPERFVTKKIVAAAARIAKGSKESLKLGNLEIERDWGWAPEYVHAMWCLLQHIQPQDLIIATGTTVTLSRFVELAFSHFNLDWKNHVQLDPSLLRPSDIPTGRANPKRAYDQLGWKAEINVKEVIRRMCLAEENPGAPL